MLTIDVIEDIFTTDPGGCGVARSMLHGAPGFVI
jgi:hypothetical protein